MEQTAEVLKGLADQQANLVKAQDDIKGFMQKAEGEFSESKKVSKETLAAVEASAKKADVLAEKCLEIEQKITQKGEGEAPAPTYGEMLMKSADYIDMAKNRSGRALIHLDKAITSAAASAGKLVEPTRPDGIIAAPNRLLTIRDLFPTSRTVSNAIEYVRELVFTNAAAPAPETTLKAESNLTFEKATVNIKTLAHFFQTSKQVFDDAPQLDSYLSGRGIYGLKLVEEQQLLTGDGTGDNLLGVLAVGNNVAYNRAVVGETRLDAIRRALTQGYLSNFVMDTIVLNPADWESIELLKETGTGAYIWANPMGLLNPTLWGKRVVVSNSMVAGTFLVGNFQMGAMLWDREDANILISTDDRDNFVKNMITIRFEERLGLAVIRPSAFVKGTFV